MKGFLKCWNAIKRPATPTHQHLGWDVEKTCFVTPLNCLQTFSSSRNAQGLRLVVQGRLNKVHEVFVCASSTLIKSMKLRNCRLTLWHKGTWWEISIASAQPGFWWGILQSGRWVHWVFPWELHTSGLYLLSSCKCSLGTQEMSRDQT